MKQKQPPFTSVQYWAVRMKANVSINRTGKKVTVTQTTENFAAGTVFTFIEFVEYCKSIQDE